MNLARSLLAACERHPELEAFPGLTYGELLPRVRRLAGGLAVEPGERVAVVLDNRLETALLYWAAQWCGAVVVPLSWRLSEEELGYCLEDCGARVVLRDGDALPDGDGAPRRTRPRRARGLAAALHVGDDRPAEGRAAQPRGRPRRRLVAGAPARLRLRRPDARRDAALPHDGDPLPRRDAPRRRVLRPAGAVGRRRGAPAHRERADHVALPRPDALPRPRPPPRARPARRLVRPRARVRGRRDDVDARPPLRRGLRARRLRQPLRLDRDLHLHDRARPAGQARLRGPPGGQHAAPARTRRRDRGASSPRTRRSPGTGTGPTPTRRRSATAGTPPATPGISTRTATCGSTAGSTT